MTKETKVQKLDRHIAPHRERGNSVPVAMIKAVIEIKRVKGK
jgi:hypothetical protein